MRKIPLESGSDEYFAYCTLKGLIILLYLIIAVTNTHNRHNLEPCEYFCQLRIAEDICTSNKDLWAAVHSQQDKGIHEGISVIYRIYNRAILRNILTTHIPHIAIRKTKSKVNVVSQKVVEVVVILNFAYLFHNLLCKWFAAE